MPQIIKVCGMREAQNISSVVYSGANMIGLNFIPNSPRYVTQLSTHVGIIPDVGSLDYRKKTNLAQLLAEKQVRLCGIFKDDMPQTIVTRVVNFHLDIVQLHGSESPIMMDNLRSSLDPDIHPGIQLMKTITIVSKADFAQCKPYEGHTDYFLFNTKADNTERFDWHLLKAYKGKTPFLLSGEVSERDVEAIQAIQHPLCIGIDLDSQFETAPALKDTAKIKHFIAQLRKAEV